MTIDNVAANSAAVLAEGCGTATTGGITFGANVSGVASGTVLGPHLWTASTATAGGNSTDVTLITGLAAGNTTFTGAAGLSTGGKAPMAVAVFAPSAPSYYTWTGAVNGNWSLAGSDTNWSLAGGSGETYYNDVGSPNVTFGDGPTNTNVTIAAGGVHPTSVTFTNNGSYTLGGGPMNGGGAVTMSGFGSVTLSSPNGYSGGTTISSGTIAAAADAALGSGTVGVAPGATLAFTSGNPSIGDLSGGGNVVLGNSSGPANTQLTINTIFSTNTFSGLIQDATPATGSLVKTGNGTLTLANTNQYSGGTTLVAGRLVASTAGAFGSGGLQLSGGTLAITGTSPGLLQGLLGPGGNYANWTGTPSTWTLEPGPINANIGVTVATNGDYAPWYQQSTWVYKGLIDIPDNGIAGNPITFYWNIDDLAELKIDGVLWQGQQPVWPSPKLTGDLTPGWHTFEWRGSNNGGPGGATAGAANIPGPQSTGTGFEWDPNGGTNLVPVPNDPGNGSLFESPGYFNFPNPLSVTATSTVDLSGLGGGQATFPTLSIGDNVLHITSGSGAVGDALLISGATTLSGSTAATFDVQTSNVLNLNGGADRQRHLRVGEDGGRHFGAGQYGQRLYGPDHSQRRERGGAGAELYGPRTGDGLAGQRANYAEQRHAGPCRLDGRHDLRPDRGQRFDSGGEQRFDHRRQLVGRRCQRRGHGGRHGHLVHRGQPDVEPGHDQRLYAGFRAQFAVQQ